MTTRAAGKALVRDPGRVRELAADLAAGRISAESLLLRCLDRIDGVDAQVQAWCHVEAGRALAEARVLDGEARGGRLRGPLHGIPVGVKDVIDVAGLPTRCGSPALRERAPATADAAVVATLRAAGALVLGKAHTTEFAYFHPAPTRNPHDPEHTPGGSSAGSAAAVAAGMVPAALGTQTVASVSRPAAYCGVAAYKPSTGLLSTFGVTPLSPLFDTVGFFGRRVADAVALFEPVCPAHAAPARARDAGAPLTVVQLGDPVLADVSDAIHSALSQAARRLVDAGHQVVPRDACVSFATLHEAQMSSCLYEMGRVHRGLLDLPDGQLSDKLRDALREGGAIPDTRYRAAMSTLDEARRRLFADLRDADAVLWPAAPQTAPRGLAWTGDPRFISPWTGLGGPMVTVPAGTDPAGLPIGLLLNGVPGSDRGFAATATRLAAAMEI